MTIGELFDYIGDEASLMTMIGKSVDISAMHMKEAKEAVEKVEKAIEDKYDKDEEAISESDINDLTIATQALVNSICMYLGATAMYYNEDSEVSDRIVDNLNKILDE